MVHEKEQLMRSLSQIGDGLVTMLGKNFEVCIHDLEDLHCSLVYINGSVTGRSIGAPATDLLVKTLKNGVGSPEDLINYQTVSGDGRSLKSSTIFIRNHKNIPIFALCINVDTTDFFNAAQLLSAFLTNDSQPGNNHAQETFSRTTNETITALFEQAVFELGKQPATMNTSEKIELVAIMEKNGALEFKGAVEQIALLIGVSKFTIYNYLKRIHAQQRMNHL